MPIQKVSVRFLLVLTVCLFLSMKHAQAQKHFSVSIGTGVSAGHSETGFVVFLEPKYKPIPAVAVGLRMEYMGSADGALGSITGNMQWYLNQGKWRVFLGLGAGYYKLSVWDADVQPISSFGCYPLAGVEYRRFALVLDYNLVAKSLPMGNLVSPFESASAPSPFVPSRGSLNSSYLGAKLVFRIGGGVN